MAPWLVRDYSNPKRSKKDTGRNPKKHTKTVVKSGSIFSVLVWKTHICACPLDGHRKFGTTHTKENNVNKHHNKHDNKSVRIGLYWKMFSNNVETCFQTILLKMLFKIVKRIITCLYWKLFSNNVNKHDNKSVNKWVQILKWLGRYLLASFSCIFITTVPWNRMNKKPGEDRSSVRSDHPRVSYMALNTCK